MDQGKRPAHCTERATCVHCGPIWLWFAGEVLGCPWCWNRMGAYPYLRFLIVFVFQAGMKAFRQSPPPPDMKKAASRGFFCLTAVWTRTRVDGSLVAAYAHAYALYEVLGMTETERHVRLFRNGRNQALRIPREFALEGDEAIMWKEGDRLIVEPVRKGRLLALLAGLEPLNEQFPDVDEDLESLDDVAL